MFKKLSSTVKTESKKKRYKFPFVSILKAANGSLDYDQLLETYNKVPPKIESDEKTAKNNSEVESETSGHLDTFQKEVDSIKKDSGKDESENHEKSNKKSKSKKRQKKENGYEKFPKEDKIAESEETENSVKRESSEIEDENKSQQPVEEKGLLEIVTEVPPGEFNEISPKKKRNKKRKLVNVNENKNEPETQINKSISEDKKNKKNVERETIEIEKEKKKKVLKKEENANIIEHDTTKISIRKKKKKKKYDLIVTEDQNDSETEEINSLKENDHNVSINIDESCEISTKKKKKKKRKHDPDETVMEEIDSQMEEMNPQKKKKRSDKQEEDKEDKHTETSSEIISEKDIEQENDSTDVNLVQRPSYSNHNFDDHYKEGKKGLKSRHVPLEKVNLQKPRHYTISIAVPASILEETCPLQEFKTYVIGQIARSACIYSVDEIIVYNDKGWTNSHSNNNVEEYMGMMKMLLEYQECPQYLRRSLFPKHYYMTKVGVLNALNAPHHLLAHQWCSYREGVVLHRSLGKFSCVDVGLNMDVEVDRKVEPGLRVTVKFPPETKTMRKMYGYLVSPEEPRTKGGMYWGYTVRTAYTLSEVLKSDRFNAGYDLVVGTSDKGTDAGLVSFKKFEHALIVFGGVHGIESAVSADPSLRDSEPPSLFAHYLNVCPNQASRTIRTEEAILITMATLSHKLTASGATLA